MHILCAATRRQQMVYNNKSKSMSRSGWPKLKSPILMGRLGFLLLMAALAILCGPESYILLANAERNVTPTSDTDLVNKILRDGSSSYQYALTPPTTTTTSAKIQQTGSSNPIQINTSRNLAQRRALFLLDRKRKRREVNVVVKNSQKYTDRSGAFLLKTILSETSYNNRLDSSSISTKLAKPNSTSNYDKLKVLNLTRNNFDRLPSDFATLVGAVPNLEVIDLAENQLKSANVTFSLGNRLRLLNCSKNNLIHFQLSRLTAPPTYLDLSLNNLTDNGICIHSESCKSCNITTHLTFLDVSFNNLTSWQTQPCISPANLQNIKVLNLAYNRLKSIKRGAFAKMEALEILILSKNLITEIENETFSGLENLQYLDLSGNNLNSSSIRVLQGIPDLTGLSLSNNPWLGNALQGFVASWSLKELDISGTGLCEIPAALVQSVRALNLANNHLEVIRCGDLDSYPLLYNLILSNCDISDIEDDALGRLEILANLNLNKNNLKQIPANLPSGLIALHIEDNSIRDLQPNNFKQLAGLKILSLSGNRIKYLPALPLRNLLVLNLVSAELHGLSQLVVQTSPHLKDLRLDNNPVKCADLLGIAEWATPCRDIETGEPDSGANSADYSDLEDEDLQTFLAEKNHYNLDVVTDFVQSRAHINGIINRRPVLFDKKHFCNQMDDILDWNMSHLNSGPLVTQPVDSSAVTSSSSIGGQSSKPIETTNKSWGIRNVDDVVLLPPAPAKTMDPKLLPTNPSMGSSRRRSEGGDGGDEAKIMPMKQNSGRLFLAKVANGTENLNKNNKSTATTPTFDNRPGQKIQLGARAKSSSSSVSTSSGSTSGSPLAIKSANIQTDHDDGMGMAGRKKVGYGVNKKLIKLTDSSNKRKAMPFIGDNKRAGDVSIDPPSPLTVTSSPSSSLFSTSNSTPTAPTTTGQLLLLLSSSSPLSFAQTLPMLSSHDNSQINSTDRNYQQIRANNTTDNNELLQLSYLPFHTTDRVVANNGAEKRPGESLGLLSSTLQSSHNYGQDRDGNNGIRVVEQQHKQTTKEVIDLNIPFTDNNSSKGILIHGVGRMNEHQLPVYTPIPSTHNATQWNSMPTYETKSRRKTGSLNESRDNAKNLITPPAHDNKLESSSTHIPYSTTFTSSSSSAGVTTLPSLKSETILINEPLNNRNNGASNDSGKNGGVVLADSVGENRRRVLDREEDVLKLTNTDENGKIYVAENSLNVAELIPESTSTLPLKRSSNNHLDRGHKADLDIVPGHHLPDFKPFDKLSHLNTNSIHVNENDNESKGHESGQTESWNEIRGESGDANYRQPHPGLLIVIGATIGVVLSIGLFHCKRSWGINHGHSEPPQRRRPHLDRMAGAGSRRTSAGNVSIDNYSQFDEGDYYYRRDSDEHSEEDGFENIQLTPKVERKSVKFDLLPMKILASDEPAFRYYHRHQQSRQTACAVHSTGSGSSNRHHFKGLADSSLDLW